MLITCDAHATLPSALMQYTHYNTSSVCLSAMRPLLHVSLIQVGLEETGLYVRMSNRLSMNTVNLMFSGPCIILIVE